MDFQPNGRDALHLNLMGARNWMQVPNTYDQRFQDQRQKVISLNIAPGYQRSIDAHTLLSVNAFFRRDQVDYYPSRDPFDDSPATLAQGRFLTNFGVHADLSGVRVGTTGRPACRRPKHGWMRASAWESPIPPTIPRA